MSGVTYACSGISVTRREDQQSSKGECYFRREALAQIKASARHDRHTQLAAQLRETRIARQLEQVDARCGAGQARIVIATMTNGELRL